MILAILLHWLLVLILAPLLPGIIAKVKACISGRRGPALFQPYYDLLRLMRKKCVYSQDASWVFRATPVITLAVMLAVSLMIPLGAVKAPVQFAGDIFLVVYLLALSRFFMITGALDTGLSLEGMGASREAFFSCLSEIALFMNFIILALMAHSYSLSRMIEANGGGLFRSVGPELLLVVMSLFLVLLTETGRIPVDDPDTHLELTMIHEVMILDHSGVDLAYLSYAGAIKLFIFSAFLIPVVIPMRFTDPALNMLVFIGGIVGVAVALGVLESSLARLRLNRVRELILGAFALAFFSLVVIVWRG